MLSKWRILTILMWKHYIVRKRRFIATPLEIFEPALFFIIIFLGKDYFTITPSLTSLRSDNVYNTEPFDLPLSKSPKLLLYTPSTRQADMLMDEVGRRLNIEKIDSLSENDRRGYYGLKNETLEFVVQFMRTRRNAAFVIFPDMTSEESWPKKLNYTIRMNTDFMPHIYHSLDDDIGPHERFGTIYEPFMSLQWAIDSSYLKLLTGNDVNTRVMLQEFPYADTRLNKIMKAICDMMKSLCFLSISLPFYFLMPRLVDERSSGVKELIKLVGVSNFTLGLSHLLNILPAGFTYSISGAVATCAGNPSLLPNTNGFLIFVTLMLHFISIMSMGFAVSNIIDSTEYASALASLTYILLWIPTGILAVVRGWLATAAAVLPHAPMFYVWDEIQKLEEYGKGVTFSTMWTTHAKMSVAVCLLCLLLQTFFFLFLAWYLSMVRPGKYGVARPWHFCCSLAFWTNKKVTPDIDVDDGEVEPITKDSLYFEPPPSSAEVGIKISNVSKVFGKSRALSDVTFDVFKNEITVLLGHNGAGKTTLMSIITGMYSPTSGSVEISGVDVEQNQRQGKCLVGLCPQHNVGFPDLTVLEHATFFALFRGKTFAEAKKSSQALLEQLGLEGKGDSKSAELSGGMKRRLQLACALSGGAEVLILDEPTSGLDVETRRELWDLLLAQRGSRTVVLSTHFMEEADALGDRVAALHAGRLRCHATPMYLKRSVGKGYRLSLTTIGVPKEDAISTVVRNIIPDATVKEKTYNSISFNLPSQHSKKFPELFKEVEDRRSELGVDSIGVGVSTLEEVFLKLCSDQDVTVPEDELDGIIQEESTLSHLSGFHLYLKQFLVLVKRQFLFIKFNGKIFIGAQIILPLFLIFTYSIGDMENLSQLAKETSTNMNLDLYNDMPERRVFYSGSDPNLLDGIKRAYKKVEFRTVPDIANAIMRTGVEDATQYTKYLAGVELNNTDAKVLYTTTVRHAAPVALNLLSNMLAAQYMPWSDGTTISTYNDPLQANPATKNEKVVMPKTYTECLIWTGMIGLMLCASILGAQTLPLRERLAGTRHIHIMTGCSPTVYWLTTLVTHTALYALLLGVPTCIAAAIGPKSTLNDPTFIGTMFLINLLGSMALLAFGYLVTFNCTQGTANLIFFVALTLLGLAPGITKTYFDVMDISLGNWKYPIIICSYVSPAHTWSAGLAKAAYVAYINAICNLNKDRCNLLTLFDAMFKGFNAEKCCVKNENPLSYISFGEYGIAKELVVMFLQFFVYMPLVILTQHGLFNSCCDQILNAAYEPTPSPFDDEMVRAEKTYVTQAITLPSNQIKDAMLVHDVHKNYCRCLRLCNPVKGLSFSVKKGECFGVLGVNGAGKSTTFKMITAEECTTRGSIFANGSHQEQSRKNYLRSLGYCPQFFGLDEFLTGRQNLACVLTLQGLDPAAVKQETDSWIEVVGLQQYADVAVAEYSGGCARRLGAAAALSRGAALTLLDEPTSGVDVGARRRVWAAVRRARTARRALLVTSHSMDEMEALCDRIAIMSGGRLCALGGPAALRAAHAAGHAVQIKIRSPSRTDVSQDETDSAANYLQSMKTELREKFNCTLKDEHKTMLHYHINETMRYSELFSTLEQLKEDYPNLIEDYSVTETTLEEVFLHFAQQTEVEV